MYDIWLRRDIELMGAFYICQLGVTPVSNFILHKSWNQNNKCHASIPGNVLVNCIYSCCCNNLLTTERCQIVVVAFIVSEATTSLSQEAREVYSASERLEASVKGQGFVCLSKVNPAGTVYKVAQGNRG